MSWKKSPKLLKCSPNKKWIEHVIIYPLWYEIIICNITYGWIITSSSNIKSVFNIPKLIWYDIRSYNITDRWILTSSFKIQKHFFVFLNLTKLSQEQKLAQILCPSTYCVYYNIYSWSYMLYKKLGVTIIL